MIEVRELQKSFGAVRAVKNVSFSAADGAITGLLGPNGAGKTTTMRMLYTLMKPDSGSIQMDGIDAIRAPQRVRSLLGALPDARGIYPRLTMRENIRYFGQLHQIPPALLEERIEKFVQLLDCDDCIDRRAKGFSQGQRLKTALARALIHNPQHIILDEPTNGLDVMTTRSLRTFLRTLRAEGKCVLVSSHIMQEIGELCDEIVIIHDGLVKATGTSAELKERAGTNQLEDAFVALVSDREGVPK